MVNLFSVLVAFWLYAGRGILLAFYLSNQRDRLDPLAVVYGFTLGLILMPVVLTVAFMTSVPFQSSIAAFVLIDGGLLFLLIKHRRIVVRPSFGLILAALFALVCFGLSWVNGAYIERVTDAWWHMREVAAVLHGDMARETERGFGGWISVLGIEQGSYRIQALIAWLTNSSIVEAWTVSTNVVSTLLGISAFFLIYSLNLGQAATALSLLFWLILIGGMNVGLRLAGWPAGMGYVFLNIGLVACYQLFIRFDHWRAWQLLVLAVVGAAFFHLGEVFLLLIAVAACFMVRFLLINVSVTRSTIVMLLVVGVVGVLYFYEVRTRDYLPRQIFYASGLFVVCLWLVGLMIQYRNSGRYYFMEGGAFLLTLACAYAMVDWEHFLSLFDAVVDQSTDYYSAYIPKYILAHGGGHYQLAKWEHQLRAALLWSGVASVPLVAWLYIKRKDSISAWLAVLTITPLLILVSQYLFTTLLVVVPIHGAYRVQFLMPVAIVFGVAISTAAHGLFAKSSGLQGRTNIFDSVSFNPYIVRGIKIVALLLVVYLVYRFVGRSLFYFYGRPVLPNSEVVFVLLAGALMLLRVSISRVVAFLVIGLCVISSTPDLLTRLGVIGARPWAIHSNIGFHWRWANRQENISTHTSWRYQNDIAKIRQLVIEKPESSFVADLVNSYYVAAETLLMPVIQQQHHSTIGTHYNERLVSFCKGESSVEEFRLSLDQFNAKKTPSNKRRLRYIIVNRDTRNYTAEYFGTSCVGETEHLVPLLEQISTKLYDGKYLSLWELRD